MRFSTVAGNKGSGDLAREALKINGADPDFHRRDLWDAINAGDYPEWELRLQRRGRSARGPDRGFPVYPDETGPAKRRARPERFADHYSQARQFYISQTPTEQTHIADGFVFELSKCDEERIRLRVVAGLRNVHADLAQAVADGLGLAELPDAAEPAREPITDLEASPALSILANGPKSMAGRKLGVLVTEGADAALLSAVRETAERQGVMIEIIAATVGGVTVSDGSALTADQKIDGAPSVDAGDAPRRNLERYMSTP